MVATDGHPAVTEKRSGPPGLGQAPPLILIVDDDPHIAQSLSAMLKRCGYATDTATTGREALERAAGGTVHGALLDVRLPDVEGVDLIAPLTEMHPDVAIVMITAYASVASAIGALNRGASGYVTKPFAMDEVLAAVKGGLEKQRLVAENKRLLDEARSELRERERVQQVLVNSQTELRRLTEHLHTVREEERARVAREIHDELGQQLTALKMDVAWIRKRLPTTPPVLREKTESMALMIDAAIHTVRRISSELRPGLLDDLGLAAAMEWQTTEFMKRTGIACDLDIPPDDLPIQRELATALFRVFQEALTNVARHARATRVRVSLGAAAGVATLEVRDDGRGITEEQACNPTSFGILGMRERVNSWGGTLEIEGVPETGTAVRVTVKLRNGGGGRW
jgi:signal transduction histidine kinase